MRGADASAGTIKSGGKTRRAAKMVILNADHPDVEDFIWCKAREERKARALRDAGFEMDLDGRDAISIQYQNANNSVRVTDEFMQAVVDDADWELTAVTTGQVVRTVKARDLWREIAAAAWECADPGLQFDTTINRWHTAAATGPITASNPCFPGDALVHTDKGMIAIEELIDRARLGETFGVYTHEATNPEHATDAVRISPPDALMITGRNEIVRLDFANGMQLRCTPAHKIFTTNRGYVAAAEVTSDDRVRILDVGTPAVRAEWALPVEVTADADGLRNRRLWRDIDLPEKWSVEFGHYLGWLVGDGCISGDVAEHRLRQRRRPRDVMPAHEALLTEINGGHAPKPSVQSNGTVQLRNGRRALRRAAPPPRRVHRSSGRQARAVGRAPSARTRCRPRSSEACSTPMAASTTARSHAMSASASASPELLRGVQRLLASFGTARQHLRDAVAAVDRCVQLPPSQGRHRSRLRVVGDVRPADQRRVHSVVPGRGRVQPLAEGGEAGSTDP